MAIACPRCRSENTDSAKFCSSCAELLIGGDLDSPSPTKTIQTPIAGRIKGGLVAGKYKIIGEIGRGGMGVVYKAEDIKLQRTVALKFLPVQWTTDPEARERFVHEARAASGLDHPNICTIYEIGETEDGHMYIAMACYEGESLRENIKKGPLEQKEALNITIQVAQGMAKAHQKGIVHRDIKPANILITADGIAKILDFGLAKLAGQVKLTREGTTVGTVAYMSPEQARGEAVDQRTDIWSLGVVLYEMLSGVLPFKGDFDQTLIHSILHQEPEPLAKYQKKLPAGLENILSKVLAKKPADRYQTMDQFLADLRAITEGLKPLKAGSTVFRGRILGLKKIYAYPAMAFLSGLAILAFLFLFPKRSQAFDSIAVLPIKHLSGDTDQEAFCDGVHQELINRLSSIKAFNKVISQNTMMAFKGTSKKSSEIARELKVVAIVSGTAIRSGDKVRIRFEVIDGLSDKQLWGDHFDGEYRDILDLESTAAMAIARKVQASLTPAETASLTRKRPVTPEALDLYHKAMLIIDNDFTRSEPIEKAIQYLEQALKVDPDFALAYAGLAWSYENAAIPNWAKAKVQAEKALNLDDSLALAHLVLADRKAFFEWDWEDGERRYRRALDLNPNYAYAHNDYAIVLFALGKDDEAVRHAERALALDPNSAMIRINSSGVIFSAGHFDKAISLLKEFQATSPRNPMFSQTLTHMYYSRGMVPEAAAEARKSLEIAMAQPQDYTLQAYSYAVLGEREKARSIINDLLKEGAGPDLNYGAIWYTYSLLGDNDKAFEILEKAFEQRHPQCVFLKQGFGSSTSFQEDARFSAFLRKMGLEK